MPTSTEMQAAQARVRDVFLRKPAAALGTKRGSATLADGLRCEYRQDGHEAAMDMPAVLGGGESAPTPGFHFRAAVSGCVAIGIRMTAAREGIEIGSVRVDVEMDFDDGAMIGMGTRSAAPLQTRLTIAIDSREDHGTLQALVERALAADPFYLALKEPQAVAWSLAQRRGR